MPKFVARDIWKTGTPPDETLSLVKHGTLNVDPDWRWQRGAWWTGFTSGNIRQAKQDQLDSVVSGANPQKQIYVDLVGTPGGPYDAWYYDLAQNTWMAPDNSFTNIYGAPVGTGAGGVGAVNLPPGPGQVGPPGSPQAIMAIEFSVADDGFWIAKTPQASAAVKDGNPHPGVSIINPGAWEQFAGGMTISEALSLDTYKDMGWLGLDKHFLAWNGGGVSPAGEELASAMDACMKGDAGAERALRAVGVSAPKNKGGLHGTIDLGDFSF